MKSFLEFLLESNTSSIVESKASDQYEIDVASEIQTYANNNNLDWQVIRPKADTSYSDVKVITPNTTSWIEVKMNITDNLGTPRFFYQNSRWKSNMHTPIAKDICAILNSSKEAKTFIQKLSNFTKINSDTLYLSPYKSEIIKQHDPNMVTLQQLRDFAKINGEDRYILKGTHNNIDKIVAKHYLYGKSEPAQYMQIGDNFVQLDELENPLQFKDLPILKGNGILNIRFSTRSEFYEILSEIKFKTISQSEYSFMPNTTKKQPIILK